MRGALSRCEPDRGLMASEGAATCGACCGAEADVRYGRALDKRIRVGMHIPSSSSALGVLT
eukprot:scaffold93080_cov61-Phaeocystis_antarctica.AAC.3